MSQDITEGCDCPESLELLRERIHQHVDKIIDFCLTDQSNFPQAEKLLIGLIRILGCLFFSLYLLSRHCRLDLQPWLQDCKLDNIWVGRRLETVYGPIRFARAYMTKRRGKGGFHPLDAVLGLTRDRFSPAVISLVCRLATRLSFRASELIFSASFSWSPCTESMEHLVLGLARSAPAYMASSPPFPEADGEILVIECDGKAVPTATEEELQKRRGKRSHAKNCRCGCQRHRGKAKRRRAGKKKRRKKGDKSKNGRSATLVAMYTLRRGPDGLLHGPINKRIWGSFAARRVMLEWAKEEAARRGFPPDTTKIVYILVDGEKCLEKGLRELFPRAELTLDIRHVEERLWKAGRAFHREGSEELARMVEEWRRVLYGQGGEALIESLRSRQDWIAPCGPGTKDKRQALQEVIAYLEPRCAMMRYAQRIEADLPIATGVVEGACRYIVGERMDCSGMRWVEGKAEAILRLRCIELNGMWDDFFDWCQADWREKLLEKKKVLIRTEKAIEISEKKQKLKKKPPKKKIAAQKTSEAA